MSRERLTPKTASDIVNDPYTMNDARPAEDKRGGNGSGDAFAKANPVGDAASYNETQGTPQDAAAISKEDAKRDDMNLGEIRLAFAKMIKDSKGVNVHASKCVTAAECMLPGANEDTIAAMASDLMFLPDFAVDGILSRQAALAEEIAATGDAPAGDKPAEDKPAEEKAAAADAPAPVEAPKPEETKPAEVTASDEKLAALADVVGKLAAQVADIATKLNAAPVEAAAAAAAPVEAPKSGEPEISFDDVPAAQTGKTASSHGDSLDTIFNAYENASAAMPSSMVRKASANTEANELDMVWDRTPNVSGSFR